MFDVSEAGKTGASRLSCNCSVRRVWIHPWLRAPEDVAREDGEPSHPSGSPFHNSLTGLQSNVAVTEGDIAALPVPTGKATREDAGLAKFKIPLERIDLCLLLAHPRIQKHCGPGWHLDGCEGDAGRWGNGWLNEFRVHGQ